MNTPRGAELPSTRREAAARERGGPPSDPLFAGSPAGREHPGDAGSTPDRPAVTRARTDHDATAPSTDSTAARPPSSTTSTTTTTTELRQISTAAREESRMLLFRRLNELGVIGAARELVNQLLGWPVALVDEHGNIHVQVRRCTLANRMGGYDNSTIFRAAARLESLGLLRRAPGIGRTISVWTLTAGSGSVEVAPTQPQRLQNATSEVAKRNLRGCKMQPLADAPSLFRFQRREEKKETPPPPPSSSSLRKTREDAHADHAGGGGGGLVVRVREPEEPKPEDLAGKTPRPAEPPPSGDVASGRTPPTRGSPRGQNGPRPALGPQAGQARGGDPRVTRLVQRPAWLPWTMLWFDDLDAAEIVFAESGVLTLDLIDLVLELARRRVTAKRREEQLDNPAGWVRAKLRNRSDARLREAREWADARRRERAAPSPAPQEQRMNDEAPRPSDADLGATEPPHRDRLLFGRPGRMPDNPSESPAPGCVAPEPAPGLPVELTLAHALLSELARSLGEDRCRRYFRAPGGDGRGAEISTVPLKREVTVRVPTAAMVTLYQRQFEPLIRAALASGCSTWAGPGPWSIRVVHATPAGNDVLGAEETQRRVMARAIATSASAWLEPGQPWLTEDEARTQLPAGASLDHVASAVNLARSAESARRTQPGPGNHGAARSALLASLRDSATGHNDRPSHRGEPAANSPPPPSPPYRGAPMKTRFAAQPKHEINEPRRVASAVSEALNLDKDRPGLVRLAAALAGKRAGGRRRPRRRA